VLPPRVEPDEFEGTAWIGITPFRAAGTRLRFTLPIPFLSSFPELNVRTYVTRGGKPGIWFMSLDTSNALAVHAARKAYRLPYHRARQTMHYDGDEVEFASSRGDARFAARYKPTGPVRHAQPGTFEHFMAERYCLYTLNERHECYAETSITSLGRCSRPRAQIGANTMARPYGFELAGQARVHHAERLDVVFWPLTTQSAFRAPSGE